MANYAFQYYLGQIIGTAAGTKIFVTRGARAAAVLGLACYLAQIVVVLVRRPRKK